MPTAGRGSLQVLWPKLLHQNHTPDFNISLRTDHLHYSTVLPLTVALGEERRVSYLRF